MDGGAAWGEDGEEWGQSESSGLLAGSPRRPTGSTLYTSLEQPPAELPRSAAPLATTPPAAAAAAPAPSEIFLLRLIIGRRG